MTFLKRDLESFPPPRGGRGWSRKRMHANATPPMGRLICEPKRIEEGELERDGGEKLYRSRRDEAGLS